MNELEYAVQAKHSNPIARDITLEEENNEAVRFYIHNLRTDLAQYIIPMRPTSLIEAQQEASNMEIWLKETAIRRMTHQPIHRPAINKGVIRTHQPYAPSKPPLIHTKIPTALKCDNCQKTGHTRNNCYLLKQNFPIIQHRKISPPRINSTEVTNESTDWNDIEQEETKNYESTTPQENCNTSDVNSQECQNPEDCYWTPEQESTC